MYLTSGLHYNITVIGSTQDGFQKLGWNYFDHYTASLFNYIYKFEN